MVLHSSSTASRRSRSLSRSWVRAVSHPPTAERVFSLLKLRFGDARDLSLADMIQATLMLMYNERAIGHAE